MMSIENNNKNFKDAWRRFKKNRLAYYCYKTLICLLVLALIAPFLATDLPWYCKYKGKIMFPAFSFYNNCEIKNEQNGKIETLQYDITDWKHLNAESIVFAHLTCLGSFGLYWRCSESTRHCPCRLGWQPRYAQPRHGNLDRGVHCF